MATLETRPFSKNYSGLINQSVVAVGLVVICVTVHDLMKKKRRGEGRNTRTKLDGLGSVESWEFGYLYQGRSWAKKPSPPHPTGWPLRWVSSAIKFPEDKMNELRGVDATLYIRFLRGCWWFVLLHTFTTFPLLFPIHVVFSDDDSPQSMTRASISSLTRTAKGRSLLWIHSIVLFWVTLTWMATLLWLIRGAIRFRALNIDAAVNKPTQDTVGYHPHPHPQYNFSPSIDHGVRSKEENRGLRLRTIMVSNIPPNLRSEKELKEYFQYYLARKIGKPAIGVTSNSRPGMINRFLSFLFNRVKKTSSYGQENLMMNSESDDISDDRYGKRRLQDTIVIEHVALVRRMTELTSLLERREYVIGALETAHVKLAKRVVSAVVDEMERQESETAQKTQSETPNALFSPDKLSKTGPDIEHGDSEGRGSQEDFGMDLLVKTIGPFVDGFLTQPPASRSRTSLLQNFFSRFTCHDLNASGTYPDHQACSPCIPRPTNAFIEDTIWNALASIPRNRLDPYQPLMHLSSLFRGKTVPTIDYYTAKLNLLTSLITENRARAASDYDPVSTAFVTFANPNDARRACNYLAVNPNNPLTCFVTMAPLYEDIDWIRVMKLPFRVEFVKDWVIEIGVWAFTLFWLFPTSLLVGLVSIQNISAFWPGLKSYLNQHEWESEVIQSFLPTFLMSLLALLIPILLLLIAKKAHTISTLSNLQDTIMVRYYKFLIVNVLVFFCVGTLTLQSFLVSFSSISGEGLINIISNSFPSAGPFYVGWLIFTTAIHGGFELALIGLPLITYQSTRRQIIPRKRALRIRPRTFNFYYWLPNHLLVIHILFLFASFNPLVIPFGLLYFSVEATVVKNSLIHVYAKIYEGNGHRLLIRIIRYSLDGLILTQVVFLAYMVVNKYTVNVALSAVLIVFTAFVKITLTRWCREKHEVDDIKEANLVCGLEENCADTPPEAAIGAKAGEQEEQGITDPATAEPRPAHNHWTWKLSNRFKFSYSTIPGRPARRRRPNPFAPSPDAFKAASTPPLSTADAAPTSLPSCDIIGPSNHEHTSPEYKGNLHATMRVTRHPPHPSWNDESHLDQPYDNPYYTLPIDNSIWLPRNPFGLLDLDDTVDMFVSLTSEDTAGRLGPQMEQIFTIVPSPSGLTTESGPSALGSRGGAPPTPMSEQNWSINGTEEIIFSPGIASRVQNLKRERDVESIVQGRRSFLSPRTTRDTRPSTAFTGTLKLCLSVDGDALTDVSIHRTTATDNRPSSGYRSISYGSHKTYLSAPMPSKVGRRHFTARSLDELASSLGTRVHPRNLYPTSSIEQQQQSPAIDPHTSPRPSNIITAHEAVVSEVIVEEQEAAEERLLQEGEEEAKAEAPRSWLTSWMFSRPQ